MARTLARPAMVERRLPRRIPHTRLPGRPFPYFVRKTVRELRLWLPSPRKYKAGMTMAAEARGLR